MTQPLVSIIIDNYNYGRFLADAIDSALNQTYAPTEIIVVDDGSTDCSHEVITSYGSKITSILKPNGGQASAFNAGFANSSGDLVCFLDADDIMRPHRVETAVNILNYYADAGWCYHQLSLIDVEGTPLSASQLQSGELYEFDVRNDIQQGTLKRLPLPLPGIVGLTFRRSHLEKILPMPESEGVSVSDSYIQFSSCAISQGVALSSQLECQRIHGHNAFTRSADQARVKAHIHVLTAYWLRFHYPTICRFANCLFASGLGHCWRLEVDDSLKLWIDRYQAMLSLYEYPPIWLRATYHYLKS